MFDANCDPAITSANSRTKCQNAARIEVNAFGAKFGCIAAKKS